LNSSDLNSSDKHNIEKIPNLFIHIVGASPLKGTKLLIETWIEKEIGCDHMKCLCGVHFCYNCRMVLCANDPYFHVCTIGSTDPHFRDFPLNHPNVHQSGEIACKCVCCSFNM